MDVNRVQGDAGAPAAALAERQDPSVKHTGQKRALLVGISTCKTEGYSALKGAHEDVYKMRDLLLQVYDYSSSNITILLDTEGYVQPTRKNILAATAELVKDVKEGDQLVFHFSGHSTQMPAEQPYSEEDGLDECLIPVDGEDMMIVDNELHASLVQPLPSGSRLVVVLDTCHSGSLLDLKHHRCNRVYVPWTFRGMRNSEEVRNGIVRRGARFLTSPTRRISRIIPSRTISSRSSTGTGEPAPTTSDPVGKSGLDNSPMAKSGRPERSRDRLRTLFLSIPWARKDKNRQKNWVLSFNEERRCRSPLEQFPCNGWCRTPQGGATVVGEGEGEHDAVRADVISLSSCKDSQLSYEAGGVSMTSSLVALLRENPHQPLRDVLIHISHAMYSLALKRHREAKGYKKQRKDYVSRLRRKISGLEHRNRSTMSLVLPDTPHAIMPAQTIPQAPAHTSSANKGVRRVGRSAWLKRIVETVLEDRGYDMDNFQNPQLSSPRPLDMNRPWTM